MFCVGELKMNVSFTGFKNAGFLNVVQPLSNQVILNFNTQLTDDYNGKDLSEFRAALKKANTGSGYINSVNPEFVNVMAVITVEKDGFKNAVYLNNNELEVCDKNLPIFSNIAKITRKVASTPFDKFILNQDHLSSDDLRYGMLLDMDLKEQCGNSYDSLMAHAHAPETAAAGAMAVNYFIHSVMLDYFA